MDTTRISASSALVLALLCLSTAARAQSRPIDTQRSTMTIRVFKSGVFSAFGHNHEITAPINEGSFNEAQPAVDLTVDARQLRVIDQDVSDKVRAEIQQTMLGPEVLDSANYPQISFRSTRVEPAGGGKWAVEGQLTVRGQTRPVKVQAEGSQGHYRGSAEIRQKDFGITPVSAAGGAVKTKDELKIEFEIFAR
jgi:polyisoprenoid-binding protein YceI